MKTFLFILVAVLFTSVTVRIFGQEEKAESAEILAKPLSEQRLESEALELKRIEEADALERSTDERYKRPVVDIKALSTQTDSRPVPVRDVVDKQDYTKLKDLRAQAVAGDKEALVTYIEDLFALSQNGDIIHHVAQIRKQ